MMLIRSINRLIFQTWLGRVRMNGGNVRVLKEDMHHEDAYTETAPNDIIQFKYAASLSLT